MEENRLRPMPISYDVQLFNDLFKQTEPLRKKLASEISAERFGVDYSEVLSWFSVKFIYVFRKYHDKKKPELLLGDLINSMKNFKCRILRKAYTVKYSQTIIRVGYTTVLEDHDSYRIDSDDQQQARLEQVKQFFKQTLSDNAYTLFELQTNPPYYIIDKVRKQEIPSLTKIPDSVICDYLGFECNDKTCKYLSTLRKEVRTATTVARYYFTETATA
jgi:hypothetical protein